MARYLTNVADTPTNRWAVEAAAKLSGLDVRYSPEPMPRDGESEPDYEPTEPSPGGSVVSFVAENVSLSAFWDMFSAAQCAPPELIGRNPEDPGVREALRTHRERLASKC